MRRRKLSEAATIKAKARRAIRNLDELLGDKTLPNSLRKQVEELRTSLRKTWAELESQAGQEHGRKGVASRPQEVLTNQNNPIGEVSMAAKTKTVAGKSIPASSFLVTEDPESPSTWHLQVKDENGKPDHRLMGAAWAALHQGYRGNKYEGPGAAKALAALKAMYKAEDMPMPAENAESEEVAEYGGDDFGCYVPTNVISFAQLEQAETAQEIAHEMREAVGQFSQLLNNIFFWSTPEQVPDKVSAAQNLFDEFIGVIGGILSGDSGNEGMAGGEAEAAAQEAPEGEAESFAESYAPSVSIVEAEGDINPRGPLEMDVQLVRPGWGNTRDNHYYPAEMLRRDAHVFEGAKMYLSDHRPEEKSVRTEASMIDRIVGFSEQGAPIARVKVFDPDFAEQCRNRAKAGILSTLECSILADGRARPGFEEGGRKGKVVEAITAVSSVDWVTRAGAGGKALSLAESAALGEPEPATVSTETAESAPETQPVAIREEDAVEPPAATEEPAVTETQADQVPEPEPAQPVEQPADTPPAPPVLITRAEINAALEKTNLPGKSVLELAFREYPSLEALSESIQAEIKHIKEISGSGRPFGLGERAAVPQTQPASRSQIEETMDRINKQYGIGR